MPQIPTDVAEFLALEIADAIDRAEDHLPLA